MSGGRSIFIGVFCIKSMEKEAPNNFFLKLSFVCGILEIILIILFQFISNYLFKNPIYSIIFWSILYIAFILFLFGLYGIVKKYDKTFLKVILALIIIFEIFSFLGSISHDMHNTLFGASPVSNLKPLALYLLFTILGLMGVLTSGSIASLFFGILLLLFGIGLIKAKDTIKYAKSTGIFSVLDGGIKIILSVLIISIKIFTSINSNLRVLLSSFLSGMPFVIGVMVFDILPYIFGSLLIYSELKKNKPIQTNST